MWWQITDNVMLHAFLLTLGVDLAMNYEFKPRTPLQRFRHSLNVSLFNALGIKNTLFYRLKTSADTFYYGPVRFLKYPLPSFNYKLSF